MRKHFTRVSVVIAGLVLGWFAASDRDTDLLAQDEKSASAARDVPSPKPAFGGKIGETIKQSTPDFPKQVEAPNGAPNVLLILTDDVGFGASSTFGGPIPTPNFERLAKGGLKYNMFHTTALCSPSRAALITGRNHHSCSTGVITELASGFPGYDSIMSRACGTIANGGTRGRTAGTVQNLGRFAARSVVFQAGGHASRVGHRRQITRSVVDLAGHEHGIRTGRDRARAGESGTAICAVVGGGDAAAEGVRVLGEVGHPGLRGCRRGLEFAELVGRWIAVQFADSSVLQSTGPRRGHFHLPLAHLLRSLLHRGN